MSIVLKAMRLKKLAVAFRSVLYQNGQNIPSLFLIVLKETALTKSNVSLNIRNFSDILRWKEKSVVLNTET